MLQRLEDPELCQDASLFLLLTSHTFSTDQFISPGVKQKRDFKPYQCLLISLGITLLERAFDH